MKFLTRKGFLIEEQGVSYLADTDPDRGLGSLQAAACTYRIALGPRAGHKVAELANRPDTRAGCARALCQRAGLQPLRRGLLRRPSEEETRAPVPLHHPSRRRQRTPDSKPGRTGGAHPEDTLSRWHDPYRDVTAGIHAATRCADPPSAVALIRFHGVLAPNARLRPEIIPTVPVNAHPPSADHAEAPPAAAPARLSWARLLKRVFDIDLEHCPRCGGPLKIIAAPSTGSGQASNIPPSLRRILAHLGLLARARSRAQEYPAS
jgi:hypothetical protein